MIGQSKFIAAIECIVVLSLCVTCACYLFIIWLRIKDRRYQKRRQAMEKYIDAIILKQLVDDEVIKDEHFPALDAVSFEQIPLHNKHDRQILIDTLINLRWDVAGANAKILREVYIALGLFQDSLDKIKSSSWQMNVQGLQEITLMEYPISDVDILRFNLSPINELRSAARCAFMRFSKNEPFRFLDEVKDPLTIWELIGFFRIVDQSKDTIKSNFANWIRYSRNKTVVSCCMKLAAHEGQTNAIGSIIGLLDINDHELRGDAINALGYLKAVTAQERLLKMYSSQPINCQGEILFALGMFGNEQALNFLKSEFQNSYDFEIENQSANILAQCVPKDTLLHFSKDLAPKKQRVLAYYTQ